MDETKGARAGMEASPNAEPIARHPSHLVPAGERTAIS